jgi:hypothetical protein
MSSFNTLPARPAYIAKVLGALGDGHSMSAFDIQNKTGLTKTQTLCTLDNLISVKKIEKVRIKANSLYQIVSVSG